MRIPTTERFWSHINKTDTCWTWRGHPPDGVRYPSIWLGPEMAFAASKNCRYISAHRFSWLLANGSLPEPGMQVLHRCDNYACVRPAHLFLGTCRDNRLDSVAKNRQAKGKKTGWYTKPGAYAMAGNRKFTVAQVEEIRARKASASFSSLAASYGVAESTIKRIVYRKTWAAVGDSARAGV